MRVVPFALLTALLLGSPAQAGGLLSKLLSRGDADARDEAGSGARVKMLELELVNRHAAGESATLRFRVKQLSNPDPQYVGPPVKLSRYTSSGAKLEQRWLHPNGAGVYEAEVAVTESTRHYLYFETGNNQVVLAKVPWVVLRAAK